MKKSNLIRQDDEIDILELLRKIWKDKIFIIFISLLFTTIGYVYSTLEPKKQKISILVRETPFFLLDEYRQIFEKNTNFNFSKEFNNEFANLLFLPDNLSHFVEQDDKNEKLKFYLKNKNIDTRDFFAQEYDYTYSNESKKNFFKYSLIFKDYLLEDNFLKNYVIFTKKKTEILFRENLSKLIIYEIKKYNENLEIAKKIGYANPKDGNEIYSKGTEVLSYRISKLNEVLKKTQNLTLDYSPILQLYSQTSIFPSSQFKFAGLGLVLGLLFSILIIFFRILLQNK